MSSTPTRPAWEPVADAAGIAAGSAVLDVGCGDGGFCALAAERGAEAHGIDREADLVAAAMRNVPDGDFRLGMMEALPWPDASFDVVTGFNAFQYALDAPRALQEAVRVARPAGRIAVCKWDAPQHNEFFAFLGALGGGIDLEGLAAADPVSNAIDRLPLSVVTGGTVPAPMEMAGADALLGALTRAGLVSGADVLPDRVADAAERYRRPDGGYRFDNRLRFWVLTGTDRRPPGPSPR